MARFWRLSRSRCAGIYRDWRRMASGANDACGDGAVEKTRTSTPFPGQRPQRCASTNSATTARGTAATIRRPRGAEIANDAGRLQAPRASTPGQARARSSGASATRRSPILRRSPTMEARVAAIRAGTAPELCWLLEHPPLYTAGTSARGEDLLAPGRFPVFKTGRGGQYTYHGPGQRIAYVMLDLQRRGPDLRAYIWRLEEWVIRALGRFNVRGRAARRPDRHLGGQAGRPGGQDRRDRRAHPPLGHLSRRRDQPRPRSRALRRHRALRDQRLRRHLACRPRADHHHAGARCGTGRDVRAGVRPIDLIWTMVAALACPASAGADDYHSLADNRRGYRLRHDRGSPNPGSRSSHRIDVHEGRTPMKRFLVLTCVALLPLDARVFGERRG